ncbi:MAG: tetratricopeptide repeat protein [Thermodesulfobacteriota bacterium]
MKRILFAAVLLFLSACAHVVPEDGPLLTAGEHMRLASIYESRGEKEAALAQYRYAALADTSDPEPYFAMGNLNLKDKKYGEAEDQYKKAIARSPGEARFYNNLAWLYMETGRLEKARAAIGEALKKGGGKRYAYLDTLGIIEEKKKNFSGAERHFREALTLAAREDNKEGMRRIYEHMLKLYLTTGESDKAARVVRELESLY